MPPSLKVKFLTAPVSASTVAISRSADASHQHSSHSALRQNPRRVHLNSPLLEKPNTPPDDALNFHPSWKHIQITSRATPVPGNRLRHERRDAPVAQRKRLFSEAGKYPRRPLAVEEQRLARSLDAVRRQAGNRLELLAVADVGCAGREDVQRPVGGDTQAAAEAELIVAARAAGDEGLAPDLCGRGRGEGGEEGGTRAVVVCVGDNDFVAGGGEDRGEGTLEAWRGGGGWDDWAGGAEGYVGGGGEEEGDKREDGCGAGGHGASVKCVGWRWRWRIYPGMMAKLL